MNADSRSSASPSSHSVQSTEYDSSMIRQMSDRKLVETVNGLTKYNRLLEIENIMFESFLKKYEPKLLTGFKMIASQTPRYSIIPSSFQASLAIPTNRSFTSVSIPTSRVSVSSEMGRRINISTRLEILMREKDNLLHNIKDFKKQAAKKKKDLKAKIEEFSLRLNETDDTRIYLEEMISKELDPRTQKLPGDKFIRYMEEWLKSADAIIEKLRLRTISFHYKHTNLLSQLKQKEELGESLHAVDFDQLKIEHQILTQKLEKKNNNLLEMKKRTGDSNLALSKITQTLMAQTKQLNDLKQKIIAKQQIIVKLSKEIEIVEEEVESSGDKLRNIEYLIENYTVPDLMEYIISKHEVHELIKVMRIWIRRTNIQKNVLETCVKKMKMLTKSGRKDPAWFRLKKDKHDSDEDEDEPENVNNNQDEDA